jgi:hypothetical protein
MASRPAPVDGQALVAVPGECGIQDRLALIVI